MKFLEPDLKRIKSAIFLLASLVTLSANSRPLSNEERACLFERPVVIGASISAEMGRNIPGYDLAAAALAILQHQPAHGRFGLSPSRLLIANYGAKGFDFEVKNYSQMFTNQEGQLGSSQVEALIHGEERPFFDSASVILGIDAFYWDAISENCSYDVYAGAENTIVQLTREASRRGVKLILGNVPQEDPAKVIIDSERIGIPGLWYQPYPPCVNSINATLKRYCRPESGCYLIDIDSTVQKINRGGTLPGYSSEMVPVQNDLLTLRPDGVHLSPAGTAAIFDLMVKALEAHPPQCPAD